MKCKFFLSPGKRKTTVDPVKPAHDTIADHSKEVSAIKIRHRMSTALTVTAHQCDQAQHYRTHPLPHFKTYLQVSPLPTGAEQCHVYLTAVRATSNTITAVAKTALYTFTAFSSLQPLQSASLPQMLVSISSLADLKICLVFGLWNIDEFQLACFHVSFN